MTKNKACAFHQMDFIKSLILQALFCKICLGVGIYTLAQNAKELTNRTCQTQNRGKQEKKGSSLTINTHSGNCNSNLMHHMEGFAF